MLKFRVVGQRLIWENPDEVIVADTKKYLECYFEFDGDAWNGYEHIDAYFKKGRDNPIRMVLSANRIWREDELCLSAGEWSLYLCATEYATRTNTDGSTESIVDRQITSSAVTIKVLASGQMTNADNSFESPEIADQYIAQMSVFEDARASAENARADAERARVSAEGLRVSAENARVSAENKREKEMRELAQRVEEALESGGGGFRKIGFTEDCDFVATEGDGLTAFENAVNAASDGETFLVMPGVYKGENQFDVVKNINFIGVGMPKIEFPVWISGGGVFNFESWSWDVLYPNVKSCWCGFSFLNSFMVGHECNPDNVGYAGYAVLENCTVDGEYIGIRGEARNCAFRCNRFSVGHYYDHGAGAIFKDCSISVTDYSEMYDGDFDSCEIFPPTSAVKNQISTSEFKKCKIFAVGTSVEVNDPRGSEASYGDSLIFANSSTYGGYLVTPTAN